MTNGLRSWPVSRSRVARLVTRAAATTSLIATVAVVATIFGPGEGRTIEAADPALGAGGEYHALTPQRLLDTRDPANDVAPAGRKPFASSAGDAIFNVPIVGRGGLPEFASGDGNCADDNVLAVAVNITVVAPTSAGYLEAFGKGENPAGVTSVINFRPNEVVANTAILRPGCDGALSIRLAPSAGATADVIVDVFGWFSSSAYTGPNARGARLEPTGPGRIFDSRESAFGAAPLPAATQRQIQIRGATAFNTGAGVVPNDPNVVGVMVNITGVNNAAGNRATFVSLVPEQVAGGTAPTTSNLNLIPQQIRSNMAIVPLGADGSIWMYNSAGNAHVILDVVGYFVRREDDSERGRVIPLVSPFRAFDTREEAHEDAPLPPAYAEDWSFADFADDVKVAGQPVGKQLGVLGNLTAAELQRQYDWASVASYVTAYPTPPQGSGTEPPLISNLGVFEGEVVPNLSLLTYGVDRQVRFYNRAGYLDYLLDVTAVILA